VNNLESVLAQELRPVAAPAELWERVEMPRVSPRRVALPGWTWAVAAAAIVVIVSGWSLSLRGEIRSSDPARIRAWVRENTGMDVPLERTAAVEFAGARIVQRGQAAEIVYKAANFDATLLVTRPGRIPVNASHPTVRGLVLAVNCASPEGMQAACRLCHG
jgi:hypothetical protein